MSENNVQLPKYKIFFSIQVSLFRILYFNNKKCLDKLNKLITLKIKALRRKAWFVFKQKLIIHIEKSVF